MFLAIFQPQLKRFAISVFCFLLTVLLAWNRTMAQDTPYFVTYDHHLEPAGTLEIETFATLGLPNAPEAADPQERGQRFYAAPYAEIEYSILNRWTTALYIEGQSTAGDSALFTGWRWENRWRPLKREHRINPVLYLEFESLNEASRIAKDIAGEGPDLDVANSELQPMKAHELETKLILSSDFRGWNVAENFLVEKNLSKGEGYEFGYAFGVSRDLGMITSASHCSFCRQRFVLGVESYGALGGTAHGFGWHDTAQYIAPAISYRLGERGTLHFSTAFGIGHEGSRLLLRIGYTHEIQTLHRTPRLPE
jgi:hypothetical protein